MTGDPLAAWYAALRAGDAAALRAAMAAGATVVWHGAPGVTPWAGTHEGPEAVLAFFALVASHLEILEVRERHRITEGARVAVQAEGRWRARATGREVQAAMCNVFTLEGPKVARFEVHPDTAAFRDALG